MRKRDTTAEQATVVGLFRGDRNHRIMPAIGLLILAAAAMTAAAQPEYAYPDIDLEGRLYRSVFQSGTGTLAENDLAAVPPPHRARLGRYLTRRASYQSAFEGSATGFEGAARDAKKRVFERAIVSLIETPDAAKLALEFVSKAPIAHEWEGSPAGPLEEADYAERVLKENPAGALAPFLYVFIAQRQRAAFEAQERAKDEDAMKASAKKYRAFMQRARGAPDQIFALIADDLDRQPNVYLKTDTHPRDFNPDA